MYETAMLKPFRLKTTNGDMLAYYGNCKINITSQPFDSIKNRNKSETPFDIGLKAGYTQTESKRITTTTHVLALNQKRIGDFLAYTGYESTNINLNNTPIQGLPDLNHAATFTAINDFINSISDNSLKKSLKAILYNLTHGNTPYANVDLQETKFQSTFVFQYDDYEMQFIRDDTFYPTGINNYPQNAIIFIAQDWTDDEIMPHPCFFYQKDTLCRYIDNSVTNIRLPSYGISMAGYDTIYFYWTTYKGV